MLMQPLKTLVSVTVFILVFITSGYSQTPVKNYDKEWKKVEAFLEKQLYESALKDVKIIYQLAKKEKQDAQMIKALVFMAGLQNETELDNEVETIKEFEDEIKKSKEPVKSILKSLLAEQYQTYYRNHIGFRRYGQTRTENFNKTDIKTWGTEDFQKKISELFLESIKEEKLLQKISLNEYKAIIGKGNVSHLRPTLYDLLAHRALNHFSYEPRNIPKPAYAFEINQATAFDPAAAFINAKFPTKDTSSLFLNALLIYQKIIAFHLNDKKPDAIIDVDLQRLEFVRKNSTHPEKDTLYFNTVKYVANKYKNLPAASQAWYLMASYYNEKAASYNPFGDTTYRFEKLKAKQICEQVLQQKDSSEGKINCFNLLKEIHAKSLFFNVEKVNIPEQPFRVLVKYKNIGPLYLRLIKANETPGEPYSSQADDKYWIALTNAKPVKSWKVNLPATNDYQVHSVEIKAEALPPDKYFLIASDNESFSGEKVVLGARQFYVSNISYIHNGYDYFVLNRNTGQPLSNAKAQVWVREYDYNQSKYTKEKVATFTSNSNGFFRIDKLQKDDVHRPNYYSLDILYNNDSLYLDDNENVYYSNTIIQEPKPITTINLFTDRSIYRPGQVVYFKGIAFDKNEKKNNPAVKEGYSTKVFLVDANYQYIDSIKVTTNIYGSFDGKFQLPASGLNGSFSIQTPGDYSYAGFKVEEYKRPKFYVDYEPIKGVYKVNDKIKITGLAKAYAGNNIDGAKVKYRVVRQPRFLYPWLSRRWWLPPAESMEIAHGETQTDKEGKFYIEFAAIPDLKIDKKTDPVFDYKIYADITDINGETRSGEKIVSVSYKSLILKTDIPASITIDSLRSIYIHTENMNGEFEPVRLKVVFTKLKEEKRLIRERYWDRPDQFIMTKEEYIRNFPNDEYENESNFRNWSKEQFSYEKNDSSKTNGDWSVEKGKLSPGFYQIDIKTKDKNGEEVKDVQFIELINDKKTQLNKSEYLWTGNRTTITEPGQSAKIELGTSADNLFIIHLIDKPKDETNPLYNYNFQTLNNEKKAFSFPVTEADRGGFGVSWVFVKHNRFYKANETISVPWTNKELKIEYGTFRDKTLPGSTENWKIKITGYKKEKVAAEILASMYDASLDQFYPHNWIKPFIWRNYSQTFSWESSKNFSHLQSIQKYINEEKKSVEKDYDDLFMTSKGYGIPIYGDLLGRNPRLMRLPKPVLKSEAEAEMLMEAGVALPDSDGDGLTDQFDTEQNAPEEAAELKRKREEARKKKSQQEEIKIRKNFNETAFFYPHLNTNENGDIEFSFTIPEALTKWKFQALAHTKDLAFGYSTKEIVTQKQLMVQPNPPRFLREGDKIEFTAKIVNLTDKELTGQAELQLFDAATNESVSGWFNNIYPNQYFTVAAGQSEAVTFPLQVPFLFDKALIWRIVARAGDVSDGEEAAMPVLTNRMLVTETLPLNVRGQQTKNFRFEKLLTSGNSETLQHQSLTVEYTSNPAWYAVQALPYLMEYPYECAEQTWNRFYANALASKIANSSPRIKQIFESWDTKDTAALLSNLQKNQELKAVLLEETPWVLQAKTEAQQKKNIALLFDMVKMSSELNSNYEKLKQMQSPNGGFVWFKGGPDDRYITQYIITGIGHLKKLGVDVKKLEPIVNLAIPYLDKKIKEDHDYLVKNKISLEQQNISYTQIQYLYMRSFFIEMEPAKEVNTAFKYFWSQTEKYWTKQSKYMQGMIALISQRFSSTPLNDKKFKNLSKEILASLKERSIKDEEMGMFWKENTRGWFWYQAPIETQALMIEAFSEIGKDPKTVDDLKTWLLKNKQTNSWESTKATAEACYALLLQGTDLLNNESIVEIKLGNTTISSADNKQEAGTGYFKKTINGPLITPNMGNINLTIQPLNNQTNTSTSWGGVYWQYFQDLDKITTASTPLKLDKKLFVEKNTDRGPTLTPIKEGDVVKVGDKIKVRIELRVDRDMEYVHMKDMRASCLEPVNVLSSYKWQGGLGYYETTKDASTNFFFNYLRRGTYVFEYPLSVTHTGNFSNGITSIQCMYAPEFSSHSEGIRINVE